MAEGFEPSDGGYPSHAFEACSLGRSDTPPPELDTGTPRGNEIAPLPAVRKNVSSSAAHSPSNTPPRTSGRWVSRRSRTTSHSDPTAPVLGSQAPKTRRPTRAGTRRPRTSCTGSRVTASVAPSRRQPSPWTRGGGAQREDLGVRGGVAERFAGVAAPREFDTVRVEDHRADRDVRARRPLPRPRARARIRSVVAPAVTGADQRCERVQHADSSSAKPRRAAIMRELLVGVQVGVGDDHAQHRFGQAEIGQQTEVALLPGLDVVEIVGVDVGDLDVHRVEHVRGDVVVERRGRVGEQQTGARRGRAVGPRRTRRRCRADRTPLPRCASPSAGSRPPSGWSGPRSVSAVHRHLPSSRTTATANPSGGPRVCPVRCRPRRCAPMAPTLVRSRAC